MSSVTTAAAVFLIQLLLLDPTKGAKILFVPTAVNSHVLYFGRLADDLARLGHDVHMLIPSNVKIPEGFAGNGPNTTGNGTRGNYEITVYPVDDAEPYVSSPNASENLVKTAMSRSAIEQFRLSMEFGLQLYTHMERDCVRLLENRPVMDAVRTAGYQFAVMDLLAFHCYFALPYGADIPFGSLSLAWTTLMYRVPRLPSFHSILPDVDHSSVTGRLLSLLHDLAGFVTAMTMISTKHIETYAPDRPVIDILELLRRPSLWFYLEDIAVGKPLPLMPNTIAVGDIMAGREGRELPPELEQFMSQHVSSVDDVTGSNISGNARAVIIVSFGSFFDHVPDDVVAKFCDVFRRLPAGLAVVWKMKKPDVCRKGENGEDRIRIMPWIPQNDLLADPRVRLFITHAGLNSIIESAYHGKPIIAFPIALDQPNNAQMAASKGFGIRMDIGDFDAEGLLSAIDAVLTDSKYRLNAERASAIMRDRRQTPAERVSDAIEHVIKYGDKDLRTAAFDLNVMQFIMFDIFAFMFVVFIAISAATISVCCVVRRRCCGHRMQKKRKED